MDVSGDAARVALLNYAGAVFTAFTRFVAHPFSQIPPADEGQPGVQALHRRHLRGQAAVQPHEQHAVSVLAVAACARVLFLDGVQLLVGERPVVGELSPLQRRRLQVLRGQLEHERAEVLGVAAAVREEAHLCGSAGVEMLVKSNTKGREEKHSS